MAWTSKELAPPPASTAAAAAAATSVKNGESKINGTTHTNGVAKSAVLHAKLDAPPPKAVGSEGYYITAEDGSQILDASSGAAVACIGHNNQRVKNAISKQLDSIAYCYGPFFTNEPLEKLSQELCLSTGGKMSRVFIVSSGTEAIEAAMKMARQYFLELSCPQPRRTHFIARHHSYHGNTLGSLALGGHVARRAPYMPILATNVSHVSPCYAYRNQNFGESDESYVARLAQELEDEFQRVGSDTICAFVAETMVGTTTGSVPPTPGYFKAMREVCDRHGALLILDEVMSGMGRTGTLHAWEQEDIVPDLQTIAKGLGAGYYPIGALMISAKIVDALEEGTGAFVHSQTYQGHPAACAAAYEVQQVIKENDLLANVRAMGPFLGKLLRARLGNHENVGDIRGRGLLWGVEFVKDKQTKEPFPAAKKVSAVLHKTALMKYHVSCIPCAGVADGVNGDVIIISPPYTIDAVGIELVVKRIGQAITDVLG